jgi:hypothetical protein
MQSRLTFVWLAVAALAIAPPLLPSARGGHAVVFGVREHGTLENFDEYPFESGDLSLRAAYEYHDGPAFWQVGVDYSLDPSRSGTADFAITPQLNLLFKDKLFCGGLGVLKTYFADDAAEDEWTPFYWQWILGLKVPLGKWFTLDVYALYPFEKWGNFFSDFDLSTFEFGLSAGLTF